MLYLATDSDLMVYPIALMHFRRSQRIGNTDGDGIGVSDTDDGDGVDDAIDWLPRCDGVADTDGDVGDNRDPDDDNDGIPDLADDEPLISSLDSTATVS